ncbi:hypothetical protein J6590_051635 [Homalodisca vitripennis]|nr:hypothetical protein J6590_051635 [Homalodisca vitripennis]
MEAEYGNMTDPREHLLAVKIDKNLENASVTGEGGRGVGAFFRTQSVPHRTNGRAVPRAQRCIIKIPEKYGGNWVYDKRLMATSLHSIARVRCWGTIRHRNRVMAVKEVDRYQPEQRGCELETSRRRDAERFKASFSTALAGYIIFIWEIRIDKMEKEKLSAMLRLEAEAAVAKFMLLQSQELGTISQFVKRSCLVFMSKV